VNYSSSKLAHQGPEAKDHFLQHCCWGPRCLCDTKQMVAGGEKVGASEAARCCCHCPVFRHLPRSPRCFCSSPRKPRHGKGCSRPLPSMERVHSGSGGHRAAFLCQGWCHRSRREEGGGLKLRNSACSPRGWVGSAPLKAPICLRWLAGRVGALVFAVRVHEDRR